MGRGGNKTQRIDIIDSYDPRVVGRSASKGTLFRYIPSVGDPELLIKTDEGFSTSWEPVGGSSAVLPITPVAAGSTANVNIASAPASIDGVVLSNGDLVLIKNQTLPEENGVYTFNGTGSALTRAPEWALAQDFVPGRQVFVDEGTTNEDTLWLNADYVVTLGTDPVLFVGAVPVGLQTKIEHITLTPTDITNQFVTLSETPVDPTEVALDVISGGPQAIGTDFSVAGDQLAFLGDLATGGSAELQSGDVLRVIYQF